MLDVELHQIEIERNNSRIPKRWLYSIQYNT